ncbi:MAG: ATP-binding protein, partial [Ignavibacteriales bacterium]
IDLTTGEVVYSGPIDQLWPFAPDEIKTKKFTLNETMEFYHPDDRERVGAQIKDTLEGRAPVFDSEYRVLSKSGEWIWMHARGRIVKRDGAGRPLFASGTMTDITERKKAEEEVKKANDKLEELNATKDKLFSILAHDLRGPFSGFIGVTEELMRSLDALTKEEIATYAAVLHNTAKKTLELLTNLLEWSRLQAGKVDFRHGEYYLFLEVENIRNLLSSMAKNKSIDIINEVTEDMIVYADLHVLSTVLRNLISNSIKFTPQGGKIFVRSELANGSIKITVADTGIGMTEETMEKVFRVDSGYTTLGTNGEEGSGLGLVLCKDLVEKSGGTILVASIPGKGTNFIFTLPAAKA